MSELADVLERYRRGAELIATITTGAAGPELDFQPAENKWSVRMIVCHLADSEVVAAMRYRQIIAEEKPVLRSFNGEAWAERLDYKKRKISQALEGFRRVRTENYELMKDLPESVFTRTGEHTEDGVVTLFDLLKHNAEHAESHAQQIRNVRAAYKEHRTKQVTS